MGLFIKQDDNRTELQNRLVTELQEKARQRAKDNDLVDGVDDSQYVKGTKNTTSLAWLWLILIAASVVVIIWLIINGVAR